VVQERSSRGVSKQKLQLLDCCLPQEVVDPAAALYTRHESLLNHGSEESACMPRVTTVVGGLSAVLAWSSTEHVPPAHEGSASIPGVTSPALFVALC
jgi:hypothetical protein